MRIRATTLDDVFVYPCSKADVKAAFGDDLLESAWFGLTTEFSFDSRVTHRPQIHGKVLMSLSVSRENKASLYLYRIRREAYPDEVREAMRDLMKTRMRPWTEEKTRRADTEILGYEKLIVELDGDTLRPHEARFL